jgi:glycosyltransferase involved in cell wall biosynthesis
VTESPPLRVVVVAPGHPRCGPGAVATAAFRLYEQLQRDPECVTWYIGCQDGHMDLKWRIAQPYTETEYIYSPLATDGFMCANRDPLFPHELELLVRTLRPDIIHFMGFAGVGIEAIDIAARAAPRARIISTLHDHEVICAHGGEMVTRPDHRPCAAAGPDACARCFPERDPGGFWLRSHYLRRFLDQVDQFVTPTACLRQRHIDWGLPSGKMAVLPDVGASSDDGADDGPRRIDGVLRVACFGGPSRLRGVAVVVEAARILSGNRAVAIEVYGGIGHGAGELRDEADRVAALPGTTVRFGDSPEPSEIGALMRAVDAVLVPSAGGPAERGVIDAAMRNRRPVICSGAVGAAEDVRDGLDGFHFPAGDAVTLARLLERLAALPHKLRELVPGLRRPAPPAEAAARHVALYRHVGLAAR